MCDGAIRAGCSAEMPDMFATMVTGIPNRRNVLAGCCWTRILHHSVDTPFVYQIIQNPSCIPEFTIYKEIEKYFKTYSTDKYNKMNIKI